MQRLTAKRAFSLHIQVLPVSYTHLKRRGMSLALCAAMAMGTIGVVPAMADDVTTITYWVNDRHDSEYMTETVSYTHLVQYFHNME